MNREPTKVSSAPLMMPCVPSVTISVGSLNRAITTPLTKPSAAPMARASSTAPTSPVPKPPDPNAVTVVYPAKMAIAAKETSIPPEMMTSRTPSAKMSGTIELRTIANSVDTEKKVGLSSDITMISASRISARTPSLLAPRSRENEMRCAADLVTPSSSPG